MSDEAISRATQYAVVRCTVVRRTSHRRIIISTVGGFESASRIKAAEGGHFTTQPFYSTWF